MAKQKYYAVAVGKRPGIYYSWEECRAVVDGVKGAVYKSFPSVREAAAFIADFDGPESTGSSGKDTEKKEEINDRIREKVDSLEAGEVVAFVDGSYDSANECSGFGAILIFSGGKREELSGHFDKDCGGDFIALRNVAAELEGVKAAVNRAVECGMKRISVYYDYTGIEKWATDSWKANKDITKDYKSFIRENEKQTEIGFFKVESHTGVTLNEEADILAKKAAGTMEEQRQGSAEKKT